MLEHRRDADLPGPSVRLLYAEGGQGKTRPAAEFADRSTRGGWTVAQTRHRSEVASSGAGTGAGRWRYGLPVWSWSSTTRSAGRPRNPVSVAAVSCAVDYTAVEQARAPEGVTSYAASDIARLLADTGRTEEAVAVLEPRVDADVSSEVSRVGNSGPG